MSEHVATPHRIDPLLLPFLQTRNMVEADTLLTQILTEHAEPVIKGIIRKKLGVTLSPSDGRLENQEALEVESDCLAALLTELNEVKSNSDSKTINNFRSYVAVITFHVCYKHLRQKNPQRRQLKDRLRYLLNNRPELALWQSGEREWLCGLAEWRGSEHAGHLAGQLTQSLDSLEVDLQKRLAGRSGVAETQLDELLPAVLKWAGRPVEFDELVNAVAEVHGIKRVTEQAGATEEEVDKQLANLPDPRADIATELDRRSYLKKLWEEINLLPLRQRTALLLNLRDEKGRGMIVMFLLTDTANMTQIAEALEISPEKFAVMWNDLPWEDTAIAEYLDLARQQVVNLRKSARERLARRMRGF